MPGPTKKTRRLNHEQRHQQILEAALKIFSQKGYSGARTKDIARLAGISETLLFQHFGSKENLYAEAMEALFVHHPVLPELVQYMEKGDDYNVLYHLAEHMIGHARRDPRIIRMILFSALDGIRVQHGHDADGDHDNDDFEKEVSPHPMVRGLVKYFEHRAAQGAYVDINIELAVRMFFYSAWMYAVDCELNILGKIKEFAEKQAIDTMVRLFLAGLHRR